MHMPAIEQPHLITDILDLEILITEEEVLILITTEELLQIEIIIIEIIAILIELEQIVAIQGHVITTTVVLVLLVTIVVVEAQEHLGHRQLALQEVPTDHQVEADRLVLRVALGHQVEEEEEGKNSKKSEILYR